jgi:hypothetical protein
MLARQALPGAVWQRAVWRERTHPTANRKKIWRRQCHMEATTGRATSSKSMSRSRAGRVGPLVERQRASG